MTESNIKNLKHVLNGLMALFIFAFVNSILNGTGITEIMELVEDVLYMNTLLFFVGVVGSSILLRRSSRG